MPGPAPTSPAPLGSSGVFVYNLGLTSASLGSASSHTFLAFFIQQSSFVRPLFQSSPAPQGNLQFTTTAPPRPLTQGKLKAANQQVLGQTSEVPPTVWWCSKEANFAA